ncbi:MAG: DUF559 domain-containing protein [Phycisphaeraceae bacterium]|nr:DUF559 domain-containing protein [Phycisphaeraceae bacterium]
MSELVRITDVSPRDGLQNEPGVIPTADKAELVELLCKTGVDEIEVTSFVSPKWVPQLGDAQEVFARLLKPPPRGRGQGVGEELPTATPFWQPPARNALTMRRARELRARMTGPEWILWTHLRKRELMGLKFRRQHPFGPFILDYFCQDRLLVVELDGRSHDDPDSKRRDAERSDYLESCGLSVLRVRNDRVIADGLAVAKYIRRVAQAIPDEKERRLFPSRHAPTPQPPPSGRGLLHPVFSALVPNERGLQGALDTNRLAHRHLIEKVSVFTAASETFCQKNINCSIAESIDRFRPVVSAAHQNGIEVRAYISCVIACPFEGPIPAAAVADVAKRLMDLGVDEVDYGDTIGAGSAETTRALLKEVRNVVPIAGGRVLSTLHLHDTFGRAAECVRAALDVGVRSFDGSVAGLGGCPYASKTLPDGTIQRAPGNISTELLVRTVHEAGYKTNVDLEALSAAAAFAREIVAKSRAGDGKGSA